MAFSGVVVAVITAMVAQQLAEALFLPHANAAAVRQHLQGQAPAYIIPKGETVCMQGPEDYMKDVLERLVQSNMQLGWVDSTVTLGHCTDLGYVHSNPEGCFPEATLFFDDVEEHTSHIASMDMEFVRMYEEAHPEMPKSNFKSPMVACSR
mmetsp:Transcript_9594/g.22014  ORF Transcript_9594/g.22014 Transcript_9594/m.22014 type:complete len:151 (+) Transcript_9594:72-524(+)